MKNICNVNATKEKTFRFFIRNGISNKWNRAINIECIKKKKKENFYNNFKKYKKIFHQLFNNISRYENDKYINKSYGGEKKRKEKTERRIFTITGRRDYPQKPRFYEKEVRLLPSILLLLLCPSGKKRRGSLELWRIQSLVEWWGDRFKRVLIGYIGRPRELSRSTKVHRWTQY